MVFHVAQCLVFGYVPFSRDEQLYFPLDSWLLPVAAVAESAWKDLVAIHVDSSWV